MAKHARSCYESRRSRDWLKIKITGEQEFVIGGFTAPQGDREYFGALVLGVYDEGELRWVGNVGTGFDQKTAGAAARDGWRSWSTRAARSRSDPKPDRGDDLGEAGTGGAGEVRQLDAGRAAARAGLPGAAQRRGGAQEVEAAKTRARTCMRAGPRRKRAVTIDGRPAEVHQPEQALLSRRRRAPSATS